MWIHAREVKIRQDGQNGKKSKFDFSNDRFTLWPKLVKESNILLDNLTNSSELGVVIWWS